MATHPLLFSQAQQDGTPARAHLPGTAQRGVLCGAHRLPVAQPADGLCALAHGLSLLSTLETHRTVGTDAHASAGTLAPGGRAPAARHGGDHRQSERQEHRMQRPAGLRRGQESQRTQTPYFGGHAGFGAAGPGVAGEYSRSGRRAATAGKALWPQIAAATQTPLGRWRLRRSLGGLGAQAVALHRGDCQTDRGAYVQSVAAPLGGGAHLRLVGPLPPTQPGLRTPSPDGRDRGVCRYDSAHAGSLGQSLMSFQTGSYSAPTSTLAVMPHFL